MSDTNPGGAAMAHAMDQARRSADEFARLFGEMRFPAMPDTEAMMAAHRRNMEVLAQAGRVAMDGAQAVARRHMEVVEQTVTELAEQMRGLTQSGAPQDKVAQQGELLRRAYERAVGHAREMTQMVQTSNTDALGLLNKRFAEAMDEVRGLMTQAARPPG